MSNKPDFAAAHRMLDEAMTLVMQAKELGLFVGASADTFFALGLVVGNIMKTKALMGRDIDMARGLSLAAAPSPVSG